MAEQDQERAQQAIAAHLREEWADSEAHQRLERPPRWQWPLSGRQTYNLIGIVVVLVLLVPGTIFGFHVADDINTLGTVKSFCDAESIGDFHTAYDLLSQRVRSDVSQDQMSAALQGANITACSNADRFAFVGLGMNISGSQAQVDMVFNMTDGSIIGGTMILDLDSDGWRVDGLQADDTFSLF